VIQSTFNLIGPSHVYVINSRKKTGFILWSKLCIYLHLLYKVRDITSHSMISYEHDVLPVSRVLSILHYTYFLNSSL